MSVTALTPGETQLTIQTGGITKTVPVTVYPAGLYPILDDQLPYSNNGVTFTRGSTPGSVHVKGTATKWASISVNITLQAGEYTLACKGANNWDYGVQVAIPGDSANNLKAPSDTQPVTGTLAAGKYYCELFVNENRTVDLDLTPTLTKNN
ncbi:hypothetical protein BLI708_00455 [Bifidobacterium imperatoris]|uniref:Uncharacterized protein n=1 Tax=Bifidobacterium imperatoris TaxID=2020965 RepID=A0A2N5IP89_9BIFI|nr:hypothetical protein [Bifidobacterium imperatoris]PLS23756.1 hypothetical protein Tam1G_2187 [Bifidobacterium imperatoris]QSY57799.1 hypothetical protein BLI708_00160 [Bifidobacterium imperatoris]QSY57848.1 hypothetical protein BLI708_00455 [Bifidobacterium imperatoris]